MKFKPVPSGTYRGLVKRRQFLKQGGSPVLELEFELRSGVRLTGRFRHARFVQKAHKLSLDRLVDIDVALRQNRWGRPYSTVTDFRLVEATQTITVVGGVMPGAGADVRNASQEFEPIDLCTEANLGELEELRALHEGERRDFGPLPLMSSFTLRGLDAVIDHPLVAGTSVPPDRGPSPEPNAIFDEHASRFASEHPWSIQSVAGGQRTSERPVPCDETFSRYCRADAAMNLDQPARLSAFEFTDDLPSYWKAHAGQLSGYSGMGWSRWFAVVFEAGATPQDCLDHARGLVQGLLRLGVPPEQILCFSDGLSLQILFPSGIAGAVPRVNFAKAAGHFVQVLVDRATRKHGWETLTNREKSQREDPCWHRPISTGVYRPCGLLQAPNTRGAKSRNYNVRVTLDELWSLSLPGLAEIAAEPRPFEPPSWQASPQDILVEVWRFAVAAADFMSPVTCQHSHGDKWVFADTLEFIRHGASPPTCRDRLFRAAANLLDLGCPRPLLNALLCPAAFTSGLTPEEIDRQLEGAIRFMQRPRQVQVGTGWSGVAASACDSSAKG